MFVALSCLLLFLLQISAGSGGFLLLNKVDVDEIPPGWLSPNDLAATGDGPDADLFWAAEDGILQGPEPHLQQIWSPSGFV